jgi:hypothetical protein
MAKVDWHDEQSVMNAFVEAVHAGRPAAANKAGRKLVDGHFEGSFHGPREVADGTLLPEDSVPADPMADDALVGLEVLEGHVPDERFEELEDGEDLTDEERRLWRGLAAESILTENPDWDVYQGWSVARVVHTDGREAFLARLSGGYSFTTPASEYAGAAVTLEDAVELLKREGFITVEDFQERWESGT